MRQQPARGGTPGYSLMELAVAMALGAIVMTLVGSLFVASLSAWRRGSDLREAQGHAAALVETMARDIRNASQAPSVTIRPQIVTDDGDPILSIAAGPTATPGGSAWILYLQRPDRHEVIRQTVVPGTNGRVIPRDSRVVATGVQRITVGQTGDGVTIEVEVLRGRDAATSRATAAPRNP